MRTGRLMIRFSATQKFDGVDYHFKSVIRQAVLATLVHENFPYDAEVSVTLCDNSHIRELNKQYRNKDSYTDVLSFPLYDNGEFDFEECSCGAVLGDIVISIERAREQSKEIGHSFLSEIAFLTVHSMLHLLGYDHERSAKDDELQCRIQKEIVKTLEI